MISVVVPVYNAVEGLRHCIESITAQTCRDFELILIDDGSTDGSGGVCDEYQSRDNRIRVIHKKNEGVSKARNDGIAAASGEYICFVDSDDYVHERFLEELLDCRRRYPGYGNIWCGFKVVHSYDSCDKNRTAGLYGDVEYYDTGSFMTLYEAWLLQMIWNKLYEKSVIDRNQLRFREDFSLGEDVIFNLQYLDASNKKILVNNRTLYFYLRTGKESLDHKYIPDVYRYYAVINAELERYAQRWAASDGEKQKLLNVRFYSFENVFRNTFQKSNRDPFFRKLRYNNALMKSEEFKTCFRHVRPRLNKWYRLAYGTKNYLFVLLCTKLEEQKNKRR